MKPYAGIFFGDDDIIGGSQSRWPGVGGQKRLPKIWNTNIKPRYSDDPVFELYDKVIVTNPGNVYDTYEEWAKNHNLTGFVSGECPVKGEVYTIIGRDWHRLGNHGYNYTVYAIEQGPRQFIMGAGGLKLFCAYRETFLKDSLFEI